MWPWFQALVCVIRLRFTNHSNQHLSVSSYFTDWSNSLKEVLAQTLLLDPGVRTVSVFQTVKEPALDSVLLLFSSLLHFLFSYVQPASFSPGNLIWNFPSFVPLFACFQCLLFRPICGFLFGVLNIASRDVTFAQLRRGGSISCFTENVVQPWRRTWWRHRCLKTNEANTWLNLLIRKSK